MRKILMLLLITFVGILFLSGCAKKEAVTPAIPAEEVDSSTSDELITGDSCANWFGNSVNWEKIRGDGIATQHGNTPWGIMNNGVCNEAIVSSYGKYFCGVYNTEPQEFISCEGTDCIDGECIPGEKE